MKITEQMRDVKLIPNAQYEQEENILDTEPEDWMPSPEDYAEYCAAVNGEDYYRLH